MSVAVWFSPIVFGKIWSKTLGKNKEELGPNAKQAIATVLTSIISVVIFANLLELIGTYDVITDLILGLLIGVGYIFTIDLYDD
ncbi:MAG: DUF1761 family protein [Candidatus Lokiarchaeota archaeon]|nr:DUF1761 family protein [Candidatus Lokiarchaeota archaeon]MBD3341011.1 DUF1761 family protein [Candidatus Lokiarchaeota archaeon]